MDFDRITILVASTFALGACGGTLSDPDAGATQEAGHIDVSCGTNACTGGEVCVVTTSGGGPCMLPDDAGVCPNGTHTSGCCSNFSTTYACKGVPSACGATLACPCASTLCQCGDCNVADAGVLQCACLYP